MKVIRSTCNYCSIACNLDFHVEDNGFIKRVVPTVDYPVNKGFCCVKGLNLDKQNTEHENPVLPLVKDENGEIVEIHGTYDPETKSGSGFTGRKVKGTVHWVDANNCVPCEFRLFEPLILDNDPENEGKHFLDQINPNSLEVLQGYVEPTQIKDAKPLDKFQFVRNGFYSVDTKYTTDDKLVFNRIVPLKSSFKLESK